MNSYDIPDFNHTDAFIEGVKLITESILKDSEFTKQQIDGLGDLSAMLLLTALHINGGES